MSQFIIRPHAEQDLDELWWHIATESGDPDPADRFLDKIMRKIQMQADFPRSGRPRPELRPNLRSVPVGDYLILYYPMKDGVQIERVLHGSRDLEAQDYDDEDA